MVNEPAYVTIVAGVPRSGTSLMMQMLARGGIEPLTDGRRAADEDNPRGYYEYDPAKRTRADASWVDRAAGRAVKLAHLLVEHLPPAHEYRVVLMRRDLGEVVASQRAMLDRLGERGADLSPAQLAAAYERQLGRVRAWLDKQPNVRFIEVDYNELIRAPEKVVAALAELFEGRVNAEAMRAAIDPELYRRRG
jgi:hypothetical protein